MDDQNTTDSNQKDGYLLSRGKYSLPGRKDANPAADVIREKLSKIYASEPDALQEEAEVANLRGPLSKHQRFMQQLNSSGKDLAQIQTEWHEYYTNLPDSEKHEVWQEFYSANEAAKHAQPQLPAHAPTETEARAVLRNRITARRPAKLVDDNRDTTEIQEEIREKIRRPKSRGRQHAESLLFGLGVGAVVVFIFLFGFFNEVLIAPFIQPARTEAATPLIISSDTVAATDTPEVVIPKINVQIPINFNESSTNEADIENDLESGIVHYPTTSMPGQNGNAAFFGHSSNNIFNKGKYKFAFVLLHELVPGDTFYITNNHKVYAYKVFSKDIVDPSDVGVLNPVDGHTATATLITCDPPGTSLHRLVVVGDQISPDPATNATASDTTVVTQNNTAKLAGNGPTLWTNVMRTTAGKIVLGVVAAIIVLAVFRLISRQARY